MTQPWPSLSDCFFGLLSRTEFWYNQVVNVQLERLQKYMADCGVASRRHCAELIREGRVAVNGRAVLIPGHRMDPSKDNVTVDGRTLKSQLQPLRTIAVNKPRGYVCSTSRREGRSVYDLIPGISERLVCAGRLDADSEGLLIMSSDGQLVQQLTHPRHGHVKTYEATVTGHVDSDTLDLLRSPLTIDGYRIRPCKVKRSESRPDKVSVLEFALAEGRKRQIRHMCRIAGLTVHRLVRTAIGRLGVAHIKPGGWRDLSKHDIDALLENP